MSAVTNVLIGEALAYGCTGICTAIMANGLAQVCKILIFFFIQLIISLIVKDCFL